ncbi:hypothetical protein PFISCL1PPCAC_4307, partial [Pristionchus fissidentatus]
VKKMASKVAKGSGSDKAFLPVSHDPAHTTDSTNKKDRVPIQLVQRAADPTAAAPLSGPAAAAAAAPVAGAAVASGPPTSEEPLSARTPAKDPATDDVATDVSGYTTLTASDYINISPQADNRKLPNMTNLPALNAIPAEQTMSEINTRSSASPSTLGTTPSATSATLTVP